MRRGWIVLVVWAAAVTGAIAQEHGPFGVGAVLGEPTGLTAKQYVSDDIAFDATVYWSFVARDTFYVHVDYLHHTDSFFDIRAEGLSFYAGIGGMIQLSADPAFGPRIPFGVSYMLPGLPVETFFEIGPMLLLYPETAAAGSLGIGARYYF